ncbi:hypothetical protein [Streptomyces sp. NBC_01506]|uniref:hypothetical protein n=1 Tax=Streptomyces sp. NBC_01506 TaxID=2903887 RepID=UPI00386F142C
MCTSGDHEFPIEDSHGAHCPEHGVTLLWRGDPIHPEDLTHDHPARPQWLTLGPAPDSDEPRTD